MKACTYCRNVSKYQIQETASSSWTEHGAAYLGPNMGSAGLRGEADPGLGGVTGLRGEADPGQGGGDCRGEAGRVAGWANSNVANGSMIFQNTKMYFDEDKLIYFTILELRML